MRSFVKWKAWKAQLGFAAGLLTATAGVGMTLGAGIALIFGGVALALSSLLLVNVDEPPQRRSR